MHFRDRYNQFLTAYPSYQDTAKIDGIRAEDYSRLDRLGQVYLDYTGSGLYAESQITDHQRIIQENVFGNPHSTNPASMAATELVETARESVHDFFRADPAEYDVIFTSNASGALKLVGESYPFDGKSRCLLAADNHNSVNGIREFAKGKGAKATYIPVVGPEMRLPRNELEKAWKEADPRANNLFSFPAQSNFTGVQHPLSNISEARSHGWDVLVDAAAYAPTNRLDLSLVSPDFVALSFYKIFGYPTGIGALIVRREALKKLRRPWFAGGTITVVSVKGDKFYFADGHCAFEDGTVDFLSIPAVEIGLRHIQKVGYEVIHERVRCLTGWLLDNLSEMRHSNDAPFVKIYGPLDTEMRGGTIAINFYNKEGKPYKFQYIESEAGKVGISLRSGCFCNPGAGEIALDLDRPDLLECFSRTEFKDNLTYEDYQVCFADQETGAVRISVGIASNFADVQALLDFLAGFLE